MEKVPSFALHLQGFILEKSRLLPFMVAAEQFSLRAVLYDVLSVRIIRYLKKVMVMQLMHRHFRKYALIFKKKGAENINLVTGSHHIPKIAEFIRHAKNSGVTIPFCWNSSGYETVESLELLKGLVTIWLPDLKTLDEALSEKLFAARDYPSSAAAALSWMIENNPLDIVSVEKDGVVKEKMMQGVIIRHLFLPGKFEQTADVLQWLKENADGKACISLMSQYTPVPFDEDEKDLSAREKALSCIENRLVNKTEDEDLQDLIEAYDFDYLFYQELSDDDSWLPDFTRPQPFSNKLAVPVWHCR